MDAKPNSNIVIPTTLEDCRRLLDSDGRIGQGMNLKFPSMGQLASDEYFLEFTTWQSTVFPIERTAYIWADDIYEGIQNNHDWEDAYHAIYICNVVLDVLEKMEVGKQHRKEYDDIKGTALFFRAMWYHALAEVFCLPYDAFDAGQQLGLPLRITPNVDKIKQRSSLAQTYGLIVTDINLAISLLANDKPTIFRNRPSKSAAYALSARVHLVMGNYALALNNASRSLELHNYLLDYNHLDLEGDAIFDMQNPEVLLMTQIRGYLSIGAGSVAPNSFVDSELVALYKDGDLRKQAYFTFDESGNANRKSLYASSMYSFNCFNGLATDEMVLIKAECLARSGELKRAAETLDMLLRMRIDGKIFEPTSFEDKDSALLEVLEERRKELLFRGMRWSDVRRLNEEGFGFTMRRVLDGKEFILEPMSLKYAFPIPESEVIYSNITQNQR